MLLVDPDRAGAQACEPGDPPGLCTVIPDGETSDDVAPYRFLPFLLRGQNPRNYAHSAVSDTGTGHDHQTFMRFEIPPGVPAPGEVLQLALLDIPYLFGFSIDGDPVPDTHPPVSMMVHRVAAPWTENAVSWNTRPPFDATPHDTVSGITTFMNVEFDVTTIVQGWLQSPGTNYGFALTSPDDRTLGFYSWEADVEIPGVTRDLMPALFLVTGPGPAPPACGDVNVDDGVDAADVTRFRAALADPVASGLTPAGEDRCTVIGAAGACDVLDLVVLRRAVESPPLSPGIAPVCTAVAGP